MRVMGLDWGEKRVGVALSVPGSSIASPLAMLPNDRTLIPRIVDLVREQAVSEIVVGVPLRLDGSTGPAALAAHQLALELEAEGLVVHRWDERMTSRQAERLLISDGVRRRRRREKVDQVAASLILQSFLERRMADEGGVKQ